MGISSLEQFLLDEEVKWPKQPRVNKVDTHHHMVPAFYAEVINDSGGDPSGWPTPQWSKVASKLAMERLGVQSAILSVTAPGPCILTKETAQAALARRLNDYAASIRDEDPLSFGFFASLPDIRSSSAAITEISYAFDQLNADGVTLFTRYGPGNTYLGHPDLEPVWAELDRRRAVVFVHPIHPVDTNKVNDRMPQPLVDYTHETTRTAVDMIVNQTLRKFPNVKVILSHACGGLPYLIQRVDSLLYTVPEPSPQVTPNRVSPMELFRKFYYDIALSTSPQVLRTLMAMVPHDHILYGSDFPYAPLASYPSFLESLETTELPDEMRDMLNFRNATTLVPRLARRATA